MAGVGGVMHSTWETIVAVGSAVWEGAKTASEFRRNLLTGDFDAARAQIEAGFESAEEAAQFVTDAAEVSKFIMENDRLRGVVYDGIKDAFGEMTPELATVMAGQVVGEVLLGLATAGVGTGAKVAARGGRAAKSLFDNLLDLAHATRRGNRIPGRADVPNSAVRPGDRVFRVWGDDAAANGRSWTRTDPRTVENYRDAAGLPNQNSGRFVTEETLTDIAGVTQREALSVHGNRGGLDELVVPDPARQIRVDRVSGGNPEF